MKRIASMIAVCAMVVMALALAGCSSGAGSSASSAASSSAPASSSASAAASAPSSPASEPPGSTSASSASASNSSPAASQAAALANGRYSATFKTDSTMFHINEADDGKGVLTVSDAGMTIHIHLTSKKITNLYVGKAAEAEADAANILQPTTDTVTYSDGITEEVYGFDVPVPALDQEFDVAILGEKGNWYDHKVSVSDPVAL